MKVAFGWSSAQSVCTLGQTRWQPLPAPTRLTCLNLPLNITFHMLGLAATRTRVVQSMARVRREEEGVEEMFPWSGSRQWRVEVDGGQSVVVCSLVGPNNRTLGRLHALVTTDTEHTEECSAIGECTVGGKRSCKFNCNSY